MTAPESDPGRASGQPKCPAADRPCSGRVGAGPGQAPNARRPRQPAHCGFPILAHRKCRSTRANAVSPTGAEFVQFTADSSYTDDAMTPLIADAKHDKATLDIFEATSPWILLILGLVAVKSGVFVLYRAQNEGEATLAKPRLDPQEARPSRQFIAKTALLRRRCAVFRLFSA